MTYTLIAVVAVLAAFGLDHWVARTRLTSTAAWWSAYGIIVGFQLLTNGWLTGRRIVRYDPDTIVGSGTVTAIGHGRLAFAPVEDLAFGFALVLTTCVAWVWLGSHLPDPSGDPADVGADVRADKAVATRADERVGGRTDEQDS
jgi:lycopene cyclase domain-containing protein